MSESDQKLIYTTKGFGPIRTTTNIPVFIKFTLIWHPFLSRTLSKVEKYYAANEKERGIVWALNTFRKYLYGSGKVKITTELQSLTYALSNKNNNSKMKRWKSILEECDHELIRKPGKTNVVADALLRIPPQSQVNTESWWKLISQSNR